MIRLFFLAACAYMAAAGFMYVFQRHFEYAPDKTPPGPPSASDLPQMREIPLETADGLSIFAWFAPPAAPDGRVIVMFHGNAGTVAGRAQKARHFIAKGYGVMMLEYRGYAGNPGAPTEEGFYHDARAALDAVQRLGYAARQIVVYGESIGSGVAVQMAVERQPELLVLEAPFSSAVDVARLAYFWLPLDSLMKDKFDNLSKIGQVKSALLIVHGDEDATVPHPLSKRLFDAARHPKEYALIAGAGHADLYDHHAGHIITDWMEAR